MSCYFIYSSAVTQRFFYLFESCYWILKADNILHLYSFGAICFFLFFFGTGRHTSRPEYMDTKPDWSLISRSSPMSHSEADRFKTLANNSLPSHMRPTFKYMHPSTIGQTNNYTKLRNFKKFHTDIQRTMQDAAKAKNSGRNALHKPEVQYLGGSRRSARTFES